MKTAIRLDDITPDMDWERYNRIEKLLDEANIKPLIGVVPFNKDENLARADKPLTEEEFKDYLATKQAAGWNIALHGYTHVYSNSKKGIFPLNNFSEYAGVPYETQLKMLTEGKDKLKSLGVDTDIFMTPAHTYDKNTLKALVAAGFTKVTDGFGQTPYKREGLIFYPISKRQSDCVSEKSGYTTLVLHTNTMTDKDIENFEKKLTEHRSNFMDYSEYMEVEANGRGVLGNMTEYLTALAKFTLVRLRSIVK